MRLPPCPRLLPSVVFLALLLTVALPLGPRPSAGTAAAVIVKPSCDPAAPGGAWCPRYSETFATPVPEGSFVHRDPHDWYLKPTHPYANSLRSYPDGWGTTGDHSLNYASRTASVLASAYGVDGVFRLRARSEVVGGRTRSLAGSFFPVLDPSAVGKAQTAQTYGRYTVVFRTRGGFAAGSDPGRGLGYGTAFLLWPASDRWNEGEINFPEMAWGETLSGYVHTIGRPQVNSLVAHTRTRSDSGWLTATIEWSPGLIRFLLDGAEVARTTRSVPKVPMRWGFQSGGATRAPGSNVTGELYVARIMIESYRPGPTSSDPRPTRPGVGPTGSPPSPRR